MISHLRIGIDRLRGLPVPSGPVRIALVTICASISFAVYFPGKLEPDSMFQLQQALTGHLTDANPPIMSALWRGLATVWPGQVPMLALQAGLYWTGIWAMWDAVSRKPGLRSFLPLIAAFHPLVLVTLGIILKDSGLAACLICASGLLIRRRELERPPTLAGSILIGLLLTYAGLVRWNAMFAVAPLVLYWVGPSWTRPVRAIGGTALLVLASMPLFLFVNHSLLGAAQTHFEVALELYDVAGVEHYSGDYRLLPIRPGCYTSYYWDSLEYDRCGRLFEQVTGASEFGASDAKSGGMPARWAQAVTTHPLAYAQHRIGYFNSSTYFIVPPALVCRLAPEYSRCDQPRTTLILKDFVRKNFLYWPCVWLAAGAWLAFRSRAQPGVRALAWSGFLYGMSYLVVGVGSDWRYHLWTELSVAMAGALHFALASPTDRRTRELFWCVAPVVILGYAARFLFLLSGG